MNIPLCNRCPKPAFLRVDANTVLCAECWNITWGIVTDRLKADFDNSVSDGGFTGSLPSGEIEPSVMLACTPSESHPSALSSPDGNATVAAESNPRACAAAVASSSCDEGIPDFLRRVG